MEYGIQLYSVRDLAEKDFAAALEAVAKMGYTHVEFAGFFDIPAREVKAMLDNNGLKVSGTHALLSELDGDFGALVDYHHTIGNTNYVCGIRKFDPERLATSVESLNKYQRMLATEGIRLGLHNHDKEFRLNEAGQLPVQVLWDNTDIVFEVDTYWVYIAGKDPVKVIEEMKSRVPMIHLKDGDDQRNGFSLGSGTAPVAAVREKAIELGMHIIVESEGLQPDGVSEVGRCMDYLKTFNE
jgi:sugar phosphate isomerase/epimerase